MNQLQKTFTHSQFNITPFKGEYIHLKNRKTHTHTLPTSQDKRRSCENLNFATKSGILKNKDRQKINGGIIMQDQTPNSELKSKIIYLKSVHLTTKAAVPILRRSRRRAILSTSTLSILLRAGHIPQAYGRTISWYEILRSRSLADGPQRPHSLLHGKPRVRQNPAQAFVTSKEIEMSEYLEKLWRDSVYILKQNNCKELLDTLLMLEIVANNKCLLHLQDIQNLRQGLRELTKYYGHRMTA